MSGLVYAPLPSTSLTLVEASSPTSSSTGNSSLLEALGPEVDARSCSLLGPLAVGIQALMGAAVLGSLLLKRSREHPRRPWKVWSMDVSKQIIGQAFLHTCNLVISGVTAEHKQSNACEVYLMNILVDTTIGVFILYLFLQLASYLLITQLGRFELRTGWYGEPPQASYWAKQLLVYIICLTGMKGIVVAMFALWPELFDVGDWLLQWVADDQNAQVIISILVVPLCMNVFQFMVIDQIIKGYSSFALVSDEETPEPLLRNQDDLDEEEEEGAGPDGTATTDYKSPQPKEQSTRHPSSAASSSSTVGQDGRRDSQEDFAAEEETLAAPASTTYGTSPGSVRKPPGSPSET